VRGEVFGAETFDRVVVGAGGEGDVEGGCEADEGGGGEGGFGELGGYVSWVLVVVGREGWWCGTLWAFESVLRLLLLDFCCGRPMVAIVVDERTS
jgi:hypothetical protein